MKKNICIAGVIFCTMVVGFTVLQFARDPGAPSSDESEVVSHLQLRDSHTGNDDLLSGSADISEDSMPGIDAVVAPGVAIAENATELNEPIVYDDILKDLQGSAEQSKTLYMAHEKLVQQCMNELGFEYQLEQYVEDDFLGENERPVNHGDVADARNRGYGIHESITGASDRAILGDSVDSVNSDDASIAIDNENTAHLESLSEDERQAWNEALLGKFDSRNPSASGSMVKLVAKREYRHVGY